jgi:DNA-binding transcriptional ArsR family regulator
VIDGRARLLRRSLGLTAWAALEELLLDAVPQAPGRLGTHASARSLAARLGISKDTAAGALRRLASAGLVRREDHRDGVRGVFARSVYVIDAARVDDSASDARWRSPRGRGRVAALPSWRGRAMAKRRCSTSQHPTSRDHERGTRSPPREHADPADPERRDEHRAAVGRTPRPRGPRSPGPRCTEPPSPRAGADIGTLRCREWGPPSRRPSPRWWPALSRGKVTPLTVSYYTDTVATGLDDYYAGHG